jgi:hypothetical protein
LDLSRYTKGERERYQAVRRQVEAEIAAGTRTPLSAINDLDMSIYRQ